MIALRVSALSLLLATAMTTFGQVTVRSGAGLADATLARDQFRADLGAARREINWDDVPDAQAAPNAFPADYFNTTSPRGVVFSTPGTGFQVSASSASGTPVRFGNINPTYPGIFDAFSSERLFTPLGSTTTSASPVCGSRRETQRSVPTTGPDAARSPASLRTWSFSTISSTPSR